MKQKPNKNAKRNRDIVRAVADGKHTYEQIAEKYHLTRARIDQIVQESNRGEEIRQQHREKKSEKQQQLLSKAIEQRLTYSEIAKKYGKTQEYWRTWARRLGMDSEICSSREKIDERNQQILAYLEAGHTQQQAAEKFGIGQSAVSGVLLKSGKRRRLTGEELEIRNKSMLDDLASGMTSKAVANKYDVSLGTLYQVKRKQSR